MLQRHNYLHYLIYVCILQLFEKNKNKKEQLSEACRNIVASCGTVLLHKFRLAALIKSSNFFILTHL